MCDDCCLQSAWDEDIISLLSQLEWKNSKFGTVIFNIWNENECESNKQSCWRAAHRGMVCLCVTIKSSPSHSYVQIGVCSGSIYPLMSSDAFVPSCGLELRPITWITFSVGMCWLDRDASGDDNVLLVFTFFRCLNAVVSLCVLIWSYDGFSFRCRADYGSLETFTIWISKRRGTWAQAVRCDWTTEQRAVWPPDFSALLKPCAIFLCSTALSVSLGLWYLFYQTLREAMRSTVHFLMSDSWKRFRVLFHSYHGN